MYNNHTERDNELARDRCDRTLTAATRNRTTLFMFSLSVPDLCYGSTPEVADMVGFLPKGHAFYDVVVQLDA